MDEKQKKAELKDAYKLKNLLFKSFFAAIIAIFIAELFFYIKPLSDFKKPSEMRKNSIIYEPAPFSKKRIVRQKKEIVSNWGTIVKINSYGYRGEEIEPDKKKPRVIIYGGSSVFDPIVRTDWPSRVQNLFRERGIDVEIINAGIPGDSSGEIFGRFFSEAMELKPDLVIFSEAWNDYQFFAPGKQFINRLDIFNEDKNYFLFPANAIDDFLSERSSIYLYLRYGYLLKIKPLLADQVVKDIREYYGKDDEFNDEINEAYRHQFKSNISHFIKVAKDLKIKVIILNQPQLISENNSSKEKNKINYHFVKLNHKGLVKIRKITEQDLKDVAKGNGVKLIDADLIFNKNDKYFFDHVHLNEAGSQFMAETIFKKIEYELLDSVKKQK